MSISFVLCDLPQLLHLLEDCDLLLACQYCLSCHRFELTIEFAPIHEKCSNQVLWNKSWMEAVDLLMALTISNHSVAGSIIVSASRGFWMVSLN
jgi:hypothetical protein